MVRSTMDGKLDKFGVISPKKKDINNDEEYKKINTVLEQLDQELAVKLRGMSIVD